jgi:hypothetical protein
VSRMVRQAAHNISSEISINEATAVIRSEKYMEHLFDTRW